MTVHVTTDSPYVMPETSSQGTGAGHQFPVSMTPPISISGENVWLTNR